jgi:hypothetical protein
MRKKVAVVAVSLGLGGLASLPVVSQAKPISPVASIACKHARIGGQSKCIARGQYCARRYERDYERYGYHCTKRDYRGRYHLQ